jgi:hypothetical protein
MPSIRLCIAERLFDQPYAANPGSSRRNWVVKPAARSASNFNKSTLVHAGMWDYQSILVEYPIAKHIISGQSA